jgi:signal recognition particle subunit SEC65
VAVIKGSSSPTGAAETMIRLQEETGMAYPEDKLKPYKIIVADSAEEAVASVIKQIEQRYLKK